MNRSAAVSRILVTRLRYLGDVILTLPLLEVLRERFPDASLEYLTTRPFAGALEGHPALDRLHVLDPARGLGETWRVVRALRRPRVDWCFDLFGNPRSAVIVALARPRHSVGPRRGVRSRVYEHRRGRPSGDRSAVRHHLDKLVPLLGGEVEPRQPRLRLRGEEVAAARARLDLHEPYVVVHPGSTWPDKAWPEERWPRLLRALHERGAKRILVVDPPREEGLARRVVEAAAVGAEALPPLGARELFAALAGAELYVGNDGGILHAAVALQVPTVGLLGPTEPDIWFPYEGWGPYRVVHHCDEPGLDGAGRPLSRLRGLELDPVLAAVGEVWTPGATRAGTEPRAQDAPARGDGRVV